MDEEPVFGRCPRCQGTIVVSYLYQYSHDHVVLENGKLSKKFKKTDCGPIEAAVAGCKNCGLTWGDDEFHIDNNGRFFDLKRVRKYG